MVLFQACSLQNEVGDCHHCFTILAKLTHIFTVKSLRKNQGWKIFVQMSFRQLRAASPKYQVDLEIAKQSNFSKLAHNEALQALVTKILFVKVVL